MNTSNNTLNKSTKRVAKKIVLGKVAAVNGKKLIIACAIIIVAAIIVFSAKNIFAGTGTNGNAGSGGSGGGSGDGLGGGIASGDVQNVKLTLDANYNYALEPSILKKGIPVRMEVDMNSVVGCARSVTIPEFGVRKYASPKDNIITFTPTKTGTFRIACSMNMYVGTFSVTEDGAATAQTISQTAQTQASLNDQSNRPRGGCGCGGGGAGGAGSCGV